jgi:hypothetical protein
MELVKEFYDNLPNRRMPIRSLALRQRYRDLLDDPTLESLTSADVTTLSNKPTVMFGKKLIDDPIVLKSGKCPFVANSTIFKELASMVSAESSTNNKQFLNYLRLGENGKIEVYDDRSLMDAQII